MANEEHLAILKQGVVAWIAWRSERRGIIPDLRGSDLGEADFLRANFYGADLRGAGLTKAIFRGANLHRATLHKVDLAGADLRETDFSGADLRGADFRGAYLLETLFVDVDLSTTEGLNSCVHYGSSVVDHRTLQRSGPLPLAFLRGCGLPDKLIDYLPSLLEKAIQYYSCFISYSSKDDAFAKRLHADLQNNGVRCWFAPEDIKIGDKFRHRIDEAIHVHERLLLILSDNSVSSEWVEKEVETAFERAAREVHGPISRSLGRRRDVVRYRVVRRHPAHAPHRRLPPMERP